MKKILSMILCLALLASVLGIIPAAAEEAAPAAEAYIMYASGDWSVSYWNDGAENPVVAKNAAITGDGSYTVSLDFTAAAPDGVDTAFNALGVKGAIEAFPKMTLKITAIRINGENVDFAKGYTNDCAAIGGNNGESCGTVIIHGGKVSADGYNNNEGDYRIGQSGDEICRDPSQYRF